LCPKKNTRQNIFFVLSLPQFHIIIKFFKYIKMEQIKSNQRSALLIACPEYCNDGTKQFSIWPGFVVTTTPVGNNDNVQMVFLNCVGKKAIAPHVQEIIDKLRKEPQELEVMQDIAFFEKMLMRITQQETTPLYDRLRAHAELIVGPAYADEKNAIYIHMDKSTILPAAI